MYWKSEDLDHRQYAIKNGYNTSNEIEGSCLDLIKKRKYLKNVRLYKA